MAVTFIFQSIVNMQIWPSAIIKHVHKTYYHVQIDLTSQQSTHSNCYKCT